MSGEGGAEGLTGAGARWLGAGETRIAVVGAGGWMGLASLELFHRLLGPQAFARRVLAFGSSARRLSLRDGLSVEQRPLSDLATLSPAPTLVLHLAYLTQEKAKAMSEADYVAANRSISAAVLEALGPIGATGVFLPSSGAAYLAEDPRAADSMRLYGRLKLEDEAMFADWARAQDGRRAVIARVFNLSGPYINKQSSYALACFIADALAGGPIEIKAARPVYRSFVAISELMSVVLGVFADAGADPVTLFDTAGDEALEMAEIAEGVRSALGAAGPIRRPPLDFDDQDRYVGDGSVYRSLRRRAEVTPVGFASQVRATAAFMAQPFGAAGDADGDVKRGDRSSSI